MLLITSSEPDLQSAYTPKSSTHFHEKSSFNSAQNTSQQI